MPLSRARKGEREWREREKESRAEQSESMMKGAGGSVCAPVCMCLRACLINAVSIRRREWEGERERVIERDREETQATVTDRDRDWAELKRSRGGRARGDS